MCRSQPQTRCVLLCSQHRGACHIIIIIIIIALSAAPHMHSAQAAILVARATAACAEPLPSPIWRHVLAKLTLQTVRQPAGCGLRVLGMVSYCDSDRRGSSLVSGGGAHTVPAICISSRLQGEVPSPHITSVSRSSMSSPWPGVFWLLQFTIVFPP